MVKANGTLYWFGEDGNFYVMEGGSPKVISDAYKKGIDKSVKIPGVIGLNRKGLLKDIYGFDFEKENVIRWIAPTLGRCFTYDYYKNIFSEDNSWDHGQFERLNVSSYMELDNEQYVGDYKPTGIVHRWSHDYQTDNGKHIRVFRKFALVSPEGSTLKYNRVRFRIKRGVQLYTDDNLAPLS
jgi:hypothetical protein